MSLEAWTLAASLAYCHVAQPKLTAPIAMPTPLARAIVAEASSHPLPTFTVIETIAIFVVWAFRESGYNVNAAGDCSGLPAGSPDCREYHPDGTRWAKSCGAFQTPCPTTIMGDPVSQVAHARRIFARSIADCPHAPFAEYISGSCINGRAVDLGELRLMNARDLVATVPQ